MTLWKKILLTVVLVMVGSAVVLYLAARFIVLSGYLRLEDAYMQENAQRAANILEDRFRRMNITLDDWGYWDDTCDFVQNATPEYIENNLGPSSITALELNLMIFVDASDQIVISSMVDLETGEEIPMPAALQVYFSDEFFPAYHAATADTFKTILLLPEAPFLLAAHSILPTSLEGPACGTILVGRYLDADLVDYLAELAQVDLTVYLADDPQVPADVRSALTADSPILSHDLDAQTIAGYALVPDASGAPALILETTAPRDIYRQGRLSLWYFLLSIVVAGIGAGASALLFLKRSVLGRMFNLGAEVEAIGSSGDPSRRVAVSGNDELTRLERSVNGMLGDLEHAQAEQQRAEAELREYSEKLKTMVAERTSQLQSQYARLDAILSNTTDGIIVAAADGRILEMNPVAQTWLGDKLSAEDAEQLRGAVRQMAQQKPEGAVVLELAEMDLELSGAYFSESPPVEAVATAIHFAEPPLPPPSVVIAIHDVTHLKSLARMQADFVTNVSHELRTPVTALKLYIDLLQRRPAEVERYLSALEQTVDRQMRLIESILNLSRIDSGQLETQYTVTDFNALVKHSLPGDIARLAEQQEVRLSYQFAEEALPISVDTERIGQAIYDLVLNALHYTLPGGAVTVATGSEIKKDRLWVWLSVTDTGIGIPANELPHIFDRFYRGARAQQLRASGSGLGLPLAQEFVALHRGEVTVTSEVDAGSTFTLWLPAAPDA